MARQPDRKMMWISIVLVLAIAAPAIILGLTLAPWFFLIMLALILLPLLWLRKPAPASRR